MSADPIAAPSVARIAVLVGVLCCAYMISQFLRSSTGVIAPDIAHELHLSSQSLGVLSGAFFFAFAASQIPVGLMLDRYGARESLWQSLLGFGAVLRNPSLPHLLLLQFVGLGCAATLLGLWASPYLHDVHGLDGPARGNVLLVMAGCSAAGMLFWGQMDIRFDSRKKPVLLGAGISTAMLVMLTVLGAPSLMSVTMIFALMGFCNGYAAVAIAHGRAIFPDHLIGRGISLLNMGGMAGAGVMQYIAGVIIGQFAAPGTPAPASAYRTLFGFLAAALVFALLVYGRVMDVKPGHTGTHEQMSRQAKT